MKEYNYAEGECPAYEEHLRNQRVLDRWVILITLAFTFMIIGASGVLG